MSIGDENVAVRRDQHCGRCVELVRTVAGDTGLAERHQHPAVRTELEDLVALSVLAEPVGDPDIAIAVDMQAMREKQQPLAERLHQLARRIEFEDRRQVRSVTGERGPRFHERGRSERSAPLGHPDTGPVGIDIHAAGRTPRASLRQFPPVLDRVIRIGRGIGRRADLGAGPYCRDTHCSHNSKRKRTARSHAIGHRSPPLAEPGFDPAFVV